MQVRQMGLSYKSAKDLRSRVEILPPTPQWGSLPLKTHPDFPAKHQLDLYYRNPLECIEALMQNPMVIDFIGYSPMRIYRSAARVLRVYNEWLSGSAAWDVQVKDLSLL